jgi:hypothetical protein
VLLVEQNALMALSIAQRGYVLETGTIVLHDSAAASSAAPKTRWCARPTWARSNLIARGPLQPEQAIAIATQMANALAYAHQQGVIHRDIKPSNILLTEAGHPVLSDFGIARAMYEGSRLTKTGITMGTPEYMSPEQAQGENIDSRSDIYSLGVVLYEMLTGVAPFSAETPWAILFQQVNTPPAPLRSLAPNVPSWLEPVVLKAMAKRPEQRFQRAADFAQALRARRGLRLAQIQGAQRQKRPAMPASHAPAPADSSAPRRFLGSVPLILAAIMLLLAALTGIGGYALLGRETPLPTLLPATTAVAGDKTWPSATLAHTAEPETAFQPGPTAPTPATAATTVTDTPSPTTIATLTPTSTSTPTFTPTGLTPPPVPTDNEVQPTQAPLPKATLPPGVIFDMESFGTWKRGAEANGSFTQATTQAHSGSYAGKLSYEFRTMGNDYVVFLRDIEVPGQPTQFSAWVYGDASGHFLNIWIKDRLGEVWQLPLGRVTHTGWQQMVGYVDVNQPWPWAHISGPSNGTVDYPVSFCALVLDDFPDTFFGSGTLYIDDLGVGTQVAETPVAAPSAPTETGPGPTAPASLAGEIAFAVHNSGIGNYTLYVVKPDGSGLHALADNARQPDYSPDGKYLVIDGTGGGRNDLWAFKRDGSEWRQLTRYPEDNFPNWAPNGAIVGFSSTRHGDGVSRLYLGDSFVQSDRSGFIIADYPVLLPTWDFVFSGCDYGWGTGANCGLWITSHRHQPRRLTTEPQDVATDGTADEVLFLRPDGGNWDIYRIATAGGTPTRLTDSPGRDGPAAFSPDGKTIAFLSERSGKWALYTMSRQGGVATKRMDLPMDGSYDSAPHPWKSERISWGRGSIQPTPMPSGSAKLPAPTLIDPPADSEVSTTAATTVRWIWSQELAPNQGFQVRFWNRTDAAPMGVAPPVQGTELTVRFGDTTSYRSQGSDWYYLDVVVVQIDPYKVLSDSAPTHVRLGSQ